MDKGDEPRPLRSGLIILIASSREAIHYGRLFFVMMKEIPFERT